MDQKQTWWQSYKILINTEVYWQIGPLHLWIQHLKHEWKIAYIREEDPLKNTHHWQSHDVLSNLADKEDIFRVGMEKDHHAIMLSPKLADRAVVAQAENPLTILPGEKLTIYISSPLWIEAKDLESQKQFFEIPIYRPSDTWFGPNVREGELCYASRTYCRLNLEEVPIRPHRAITALHLNNKTHDNILLEKISLPIPYLSLFLSQDGQLWTESLILEQSKEEASPVRIQNSPPKDIKIAQKLSEPRIKKHKNLALRMLGGLLPW
ncbi:MAG: hypothetical protein KDK66_00910 [Deltaproteobacteria bacterium]|nr:hypothetical protein [Deltaproteobacteria bacterium]